MGIDSIEEQITDVRASWRRAISEGNFLGAFHLDKHLCSLRGCAPEVAVEGKEAKRSALWSMTPGERLKMLHEILFEMK